MMARLVGKKSDSKLKLCRRGTGWFWVEERKYLCLFTGICH